ncbi:CDP-alcohol phosphatidyltransferase family protein [Roseomonas elaeocarpi]|uniref:CDP-alcohol phosphatidyltransferase family protein n=1 Tax=Roseomonas elaeocarpi TaxID=907779 RepID=A0ABV6JV44_9PROT
MSDSPDRRPIAARGLRPVVDTADWLIRRRASPDAISILGMVSAALAGLALALTREMPEAARPLWLLGALLVQGRLMANLLDGMVAIGRGVASPTGELFNEVPDRVSDTAVLFGLGWAAGSPALGLAAALAAMATAYIRAVGRGVGTRSDFSGPMAKQQRMALVTALAVACAVLPAAWTAGWPAAALWIITLLSLVTAARRLGHVAKALRA